MNKMINMSDYEKIIFVNDIDESQNIEALSKNYPFVVFFANSDSPDPNYTDNITNIWKNGIRLTKFVGIDPDMNSLEIEGHIIKLGFNYKTGLLSLYEDTSNLFIYTGFVYPESNVVNETNIKRFADNELGSTILWDWRVNSYSLDDEYFYIAIPKRYEGIIAPRTDLYTIDSNNQKTYVRCLDLFDLVEPTTINGSRFIVYKSKLKGLFHGKIQ